MASIFDIIFENLGEWCRLGDSNTRPTDYKSVALPTELNRLKSIKSIITIKLIQHIKVNILNFFLSRRLHNTVIIIV